MDVTFSSWNEKGTDITIGDFCNFKVQKSANVKSVNIAIN